MPTGLMPTGLMPTGLTAAGPTAVGLTAVGLTAVGPAAARLVRSVPPVTRDGAADAARSELSRRAYRDAQPSLLMRVAGRLLHALGHLLDHALSLRGGGLVAELVLLALLVAVVVAVAVRLGPPRALQAGTGAVFDAGPVRTAAEHRAQAERLAAQGRYADAVRERLRAVVRELEDSGVLEPRPGRTAGEVAGEAGAAVPALAPDLHRAAGVFDEVWYGGRPAGPPEHAVLVEVDERVRTARLVVP